MDRRRRPLRDLDAIDLQILDELQKRGRISNVELARKVSLSQPPCLRRTQVLLEEGYIRGYRAKLSPQKLGISVTAVITVGLKQQTKASIDAFERHLRLVPEVRECHAVSGGTDFVLKCAVLDHASLASLVEHTLLGCGLLENVRVHAVSRTIKEDTGLPVAR